MKAKSVYCEECMEEIPVSEILLEDDQPICGRCGSELEPEGEDLVEGFAQGLAGPLFSTDDEDDENDEDVAPHGADRTTVEDNER